MAVESATRRAAARIVSLRQVASSTRSHLPGRCWTAERPSQPVRIDAPHGAKRVTLSGGVLRHCTYKKLAISDWGVATAAGRVMVSLLSRRILFVTGKGGTGKSTVTAALALVASQVGKRVLCVDVDARGDLSRLLGSKPVGFRPQLAQSNVWVLAMNPEELLQEYLAVYFRVPRLARLTPLARVFDFVATGVPGTKEMLIVGKIAYEERRLESGRPRWDLIIVDGSATGHVLPQLRAARSMMELSRGGIIRSQTEWVDRTLSDPTRTQLVICTLPEEMPVAEAIELHDRARAEANICLGACFLNCTFPVVITEHESALLERLVEAHKDAIEGRLGGAVQPVLDGVRLGRRLHEAGGRHARTLRKRLTIPVIEIPRQVGIEPGLALSRAVAQALDQPSPNQ